ncbi:hypothetical protein IQ254_17460 [Nodosilinea sp. LEGE 07088]|uniref:hypothetical protein n=1 Tax=Nodosilinea sp. LEGE 07088 TaxID=2777968 RepID=UPI00187E103A|nr:hypothetical protein [Nodosilinea sp. LEGE 07088]MBE9138957.1 hypothetical protein [Nodosilinea sp. LEGE 07088]
MKYLLPLALCTLGLVACNSPSPEATTPPAPEPGPALEIGTFTFDEIELAGCGMTLWPTDGDPRDGGVYLFNGIAGQDGDAVDTMRMKIDGSIVKFKRVAGEGDEFYGQFSQQTFASLDGAVTAEVEAAITSAGPDPEVNGVEGTITVTSGEQEVTVEAVGDAGC